MRYLKVLITVLLFFLSMIFFFQNQTILSTEMVLQLNLFFMEPMQSIALPFYFLVLAAFLVGALSALLILIWDKMQLSARCMKANWRVSSLEKEVTKLKASQNKVESSGGLFSRKPKEDKSLSASTTAPKEKPVVEDIVAPDPDKH